MNSDCVTLKTCMHTCTRAHTHTVAWWFMLHLEVESCYWCGWYRYCPISSLRWYTVINVHSVHSVLLLMWLIYIKTFPISQSRIAPSYRGEVQRALFLFLLPHLLHIVVAFIQCLKRQHTNMSMNKCSKQSVAYSFTHQLNHSSPHTLVMSFTKSSNLVQKKGGISSSYCSIDSIPYKHWHKSLCMFSVDCGDRWLGADQGTVLPVSSNVHVQTVHIT